MAVRRPQGQAETITAGYVLGCDGAHSRVRRELDLTFHGHPYPQDWLLAYVLLDWDRPTARRPRTAATPRRTISQAKYSRI
jgi:2-polyprenyl-6-methoxyphenol hydroxylase-like FAD-dependent oxidoreductase